MMERPSSFLFSYTKNMTLYRKLVQLFIGVIGAGIIASPAMGQESELSVKIRERANQAVMQYQQRASGPLDYSETSIAVVDRLLEQASKSGNPMSGEDKNALVELMGTYVFEAARRQVGGTYEWNQERAQPVLIVTPYTSSPAIMFFDKVRGRLNGNPADNLAFFFHGFAEHTRTSVNGRIVPPPECVGKRYCEWR